LGISHTFSLVVLLRGEREPEREREREREVVGGALNFHIPTELERVLGRKVNYLE